jgi:hypothetical protein
LRFCGNKAILVLLLTDEFRDFGPLTLPSEGASRWWVRRMLPAQEMSKIAGRVIVRANQSVIGLND